MVFRITTNTTCWAWPNWCAAEQFNPLSWWRRPSAASKRATRGSTPLSTRCLSRRAARPQGPLPDGPFRGVPFLLKDLLCGYEGEPLRNGSRFHADYIAGRPQPADSADLAAGADRLRQDQHAGIRHHRRNGAGAVWPRQQPVGYLPHDRRLQRRLGGGRRGPAWCRQLTAATAAAPSAFPRRAAGCLASSLRAAVTPAPMPSPLGPLRLEHVLTRTVRDSAAMLDISHGPRPGRSSRRDTGRRPFLEEVGREPGRLRIAFTYHPFLGVERGSGSGHVCARRPRSGGAGA